jgi:hypothetical protein
MKHTIEYKGKMIPIPFEEGIDCGACEYKKYLTPCPYNERYYSVNAAYDNGGIMILGSCRCQSCKYCEAIVLIETKQVLDMARQTLEEFIFCTKEVKN